MAADGPRPAGRGEHFRSGASSAGKQTRPHPLGSGAGVVTRGAPTDPGAVGGDPWKGDRSNPDEEGPQQFTAQDYEGSAGDPSHITRNEKGMLPTAASPTSVALGANSRESIGTARVSTGKASRSDIAANGIRGPLFVTADYGEAPGISEGDHRRDAAVELWPVTRAGGGPLLRARRTAGLGEIMAAQENRDLQPLQFGPLTEAQDTAEKHRGAKRGGRRGVGCGGRLEAGHGRYRLAG